MDNQLLTSIPIHCGMIMGSYELIQDEQNQLLLTKKEGVWRMPGGEWDGEGSLEDIARRGAFQQTGICLGSLDRVEVISCEAKSSYLISALYEAKEILCGVVSSPKSKYFSMNQLYHISLDEGHKELIYRYFVKRETGGIH